MVKGLKDRSSKSKKNTSPTSSSDDNDSGYESESESESESEEELSTTSKSEESTQYETTSSEESSPKRRKISKIKDSDDDDDDDNDDNELKKIIDKLRKPKLKADKSKKKNVKKNSKKKNKQKNKKQKKIKDSSDSSDEDDVDYYYEDDEDDDEDYIEDKINIIFGIGGAEEEEDELIEDENEICNSDDEKTFMKETYQYLELPEETQMKEKAKREKAAKKLRKPKNSTESSDETDQNTTNDTFNSEYNDLVDMKKYLTEKLHGKPKSKTMIKSLNECNDSIKKLVKKTRDRNTKQYHKLINSHKLKTTNEIEYFKKKLSYNEQLKVMTDLKEVNDKLKINIPYRVALLDSQIPTKYKATVMQKLNILKSMDPSDNEYYKLKNWVDAFMRIPFGKYKELSMKMTDGLEECNAFMESSVKTLDSCVYGLTDAKMQILQMIGQWISNPSALGTAIAIKGPPGTGKTSLIKEGISKILGREFSFIALGGASDSSFLEGHSYTYEGSLWGKIVQILMDSKSMNPVIYFDELDKVSDTPKGEEIIGILTHLTDTTQNSGFHDKFFSDIDFDLSKCLFIFSYNDESKVNPILKDRMYRIQTQGYATKEKLIIAKQYLLPKIREQVNFSEDQIIIPDSTIEYIITSDGLTHKEEGVRNLKRCLEVIHTKLNLFRLIKSDSMINREIKIDVKFPFTVEKNHVDILIKKEENFSQSMLSSYV